MGNVVGCNLMGCCMRGNLADSLGSDPVYEEPEVQRGIAVARPVAQHVYVVRHGEREDDVNEEWTALSDRPYDPPLTATGRLQAAKRGDHLLSQPEEARPVVVVTSPFKRCIQTASILFSHLTDQGRSPGKLLVHHSLGEVHEARVLRCDMQPDFSDSRIEQEVKETLESLSCDTSMTTVSVLGQRVVFPETRIQAMDRYDHALQAVLPSRQNAVLVTHGEALGRAVKSLVPSAEVYQADYCACVTIYSPNPRSWRLLSASGEEGCAWTE
eukprot:TRINITY_DN67860_c0_g1_i1.p1 TRINITY_DN67860_c0_g1~~TRINITY_DN67860_c0_g1_i1.p1  ORF type:complete len:270 (+),score=115.50 TRINITY_DN67860_c0_g1_i1:217-1026(+)